MASFDGERGCGICYLLAIVIHLNSVNLCGRVCLCVVVL